MMIADCPHCGLVEPVFSTMRETPFCPECGRWLKLKDPFEDLEDEEEE